MTDISSKKILLVSSYAPPAIGGPQNLYNLLRDFPADRYSILTSFYNIDDHSAINGLWLSGEYIFYDKPQADKEARKNDALEGRMGSKLSKKIQQLRFAMKRSGVIRIIAGMPVIISQIFSIVRVGKKLIKRNNIEKLVGFSDYGPAIISTLILHKLTSKPYLIFLFDLYKDNFLPFPGGLLANIFEKIILKGAEKIVVTNEGTKEFYEKIYGEEIGSKIFVIHNSVFPEAYDKTPMSLIRNQGSPLEILFTGRIYWPQIGALQNLIRAVNEMAESEVILKIYSPSPKNYLESMGIHESEKVILGSATPTEIPEIQKRAGLLFLPLSWNTQSKAIIDTATPGKLTDYLIAGKPILIHAPASSYLVKYARDRNFALVVDENNVEKLKEEIKKLLRNPAYSEKLVENARKTFFENHDANKNSELFRKILISE